MIMTTCTNCGETIFLGDFNTWHHESTEGYVVCAISHNPGEISVQYAKPYKPPVYRREMK